MGQFWYDVHTIAAMIDVTQFVSSNRRRDLNLYRPFNLGEKTGNRTMDPEFVAVIFVEKTRKLHLKSLNEIKVSCSKTLETWKEEKIISFEREFVVAFSFSPKPAFKVGWPSWKS